MLKKYCKICNEETQHELIKQAPNKGDGLARGVLAVFTLGISEIKDDMLKCEDCGNIRKKGLIAGDR
jgi:uncharacterized Zn finger protein